MQIRVGECNHVVPESLRAHLARYCWLSYRNRCTPSLGSRSGGCPLELTYLSTHARVRALSLSLTQITNTSVGAETPLDLPESEFKVLHPSVLGDEITWKYK
jgi:hypothetical protein